MRLSVSISDEVQKSLATQAHLANMSEEDLASMLLEKSVRFIPDLVQISGDTYEAFKASGMTEDELSELLEREKHAMRAERRKQTP